ncbi:GIY-YIG nuclease family protein [Arenibacter algicola]|uniref:HB1, ASXL, restriction endonuclease HTH domain n=1 Tax=Arenibacter algicola TaxID=616991 RepID=A0A221UV91_9FLAO|nr:HTH domain-containing protein [Arenibacter algicola]ASO05108.1 HB1, ASXL, restriction endonuclease HTH domain [Arenibacter algicola]
MTLHEAIQQVLKEKARWMSASEIAEILNRNGLYCKSDGSKIKGGQISARVNNYPQLFTKLNGVISLKSPTDIPAIKTKKAPTNRVIVKSDNNTSAFTKTLMKPKNFTAIQKVENKVPDRPGLYCIRIVNPKSLKPLFAEVLQRRNHNIIYIGLASKSLKRRFLGQELRATGHGTFFRSLGAILGYTPQKGSLMGMKNQNNYKFSTKHQEEIIGWINKNLIINWVEVNGNLKSIEKELLKTYLPLLNLAGNPRKLIEVSQLRDKCKHIARGND